MQLVRQNLKTYDGKHKSSYEFANGLNMKVLTRARWMLWVFGKFKVRMIGYCKPKLIEINDEQLILRIKLRKKTKNHLNSMYIGALTVGADVAGGLHAFYHAEKFKKKASIVFKSFNAQFHKRPETDVTFISKEGLIVKQMLEQSMQSKERINKNIQIDAFTHYPKNPEKVASMILEVSIKVK